MQRREDQKPAVEALDFVLEVLNLVYLSQQMIQPEILSCLLRLIFVYVHTQVLKRVVNLHNKVLT